MPTSHRTRASLAASTADYGPVLRDGNRVLHAEQVMTQFVMAGPPSPHIGAGKAMADPMATFAFHLAATSITTSLDFLRKYRVRSASYANGPSAVRFR